MVAPYEIKIKQFNFQDLKYLSNNTPSDQTQNPDGNNTRYYLHSFSWDSSGFGFVAANHQNTILYLQLIIWQLIHQVTR